MAEMTCPGCGSQLHERQVGNVVVQQCGGCRGIFLARAELGELVEAENDHHHDSAPTTQPLPRISADMATPPPSASRSRAYIESLFG